MKLNNTTHIPELGLGVFQISNEETAEVVKSGIINGYRLIDTAQIYGNEEGTGQGIKAGLEEQILHAKISSSHQNYGAATFLMRKPFKALKQV